MKKDKAQKQVMDIEDKTTDQLLHDHAVLFKVITSYKVPVSDLNHILEIERELNRREECL